MILLVPGGQLDPRIASLNHGALSVALPVLRAEKKKKKTNGSDPG
jgi:hypothetical protein